MWLILLVLIATATAIPTTFPSSTTSVLIYDSVLGYSCDSDTNCAGLVGNAMCFQGTCACRPGYVPHGIMNCISAKNEWNNQ